MEKFQVYEYLKIKNDNEQTAAITPLLQQYIQAIGSSALVPEIKINRIELLKNNRMVSCNNPSFENCEPEKGEYSIHKDAFFASILSAFEGDVFTAFEGGINVSEVESDSEFTLFRVSYDCCGGNVAHSYWKPLFESLDCDELREGVTYKSAIIIPEMAASIHLFSEYSDEMELYSFGKNGSCVAEPSDIGKTTCLDYDWTMGEFNFDDYNDAYVWLSSNRNWADEITEKWQPVFLKYGIEMEKYSEFDEEEPGEYLYKGINLFDGKINETNIRSFLNDYADFIKDLRSKYSGEESINGNSRRYLFGEKYDSFATVILDDSDPDLNSARIKFMCV